MGETIRPEVCTPWRRRRIASESTSSIGLPFAKAIASGVNRVVATNFAEGQR